MLAEIGEKNAVSKKHIKKVIATKLGNTKKSRPYSLGGLERHILNVETGVRIPLGTPIKSEKIYV